ncbi:zf-HC2 domain-containing protein [Opitutus sp. ER46]|uniref:anti-sigma factor family protein n=1 Tax=Opitutus sp. ER46 TaxID=2161864 RepID=UPI000D309E8E|nr:zf-HC2 domain-containing protein [Opitutus sp. ER46]PTX94233.1 hypothetical protein DB354_10735 [Opitutus sp. ER46]
MNCQKAQLQIVAARDGAVAEPQRAALAEHLGACPACREFAAQLTAGIAGWREQASTVPLPDVEREWYAVRRRIRTEQPARSTRSLAAWLTLPLAAAAAVAIGLYVTPGHQAPASAPHNVAAPVAMAPATDAAAPVSTVVFVDDKSGWTFVLSPDASAGSRHI